MTLQTIMQRMIEQGLAPFIPAFEQEYTDLKRQGAPDGQAALFALNTATPDYIAGAVIVQLLDGITNKETA